VAGEGLAGLLAADVVALRRQVEGQQQRLVEHERLLADVIGLLDTSRTGSKPSPWWWPSMLRKEAESAWEILIDWVDDVLIARYDPSTVPSASDQGGARVGPCWFAHPDVVDRLSALYWTWQRAYSPTATDMGPIDWQNNWVPRTLDLIKPQLTLCLSGCRALGKAGCQQKAGVVTTQERARFIADDLAARRESPEGG
jgi:hypothetical protein